MQVQRRKQQGFTLIELVVVIVILGVLATMVVPKLIGHTDDARMVKAKSDIAALQTALDLYKLDNYNYPSTDQGLEALVSKPSGSPEPKNWRADGYINRLPKDPWGNDYLYLNPGSRGGAVDIFSYGADGRQGGDGPNADVGNWDEK